MEKRQYGKTNMSVSVLGFGAAEIGFQGVSQGVVNTLLAEALDSGLNVIDTAECYVNSEELIGVALEKRREHYYLFTKCGHGASYDIPAWGKGELKDSIDRSLRRLRTDYIDVLHLHSCSEAALRQGDVIEALQEARAAGRTRYIGYSGDSDAALFAIKSGVFDSLEISVNIADQEAIDRVLPEARAANMGVMVKRPLANVAWKEKTYPDYYYIQEYWKRLQKLDFDFIKGNIAKEVDTALRFTLSMPGVHTAIVGTTNPKHWEANAKIVEKGHLTESEIEAIRKRWQQTANKDWVGQN